MIIKKDYALICENLIVDDTHKVTIVNVFDTIYTEKVPSIHAALFFVAQIIVEDPDKKDESNTIFELKVITPSGKELFSRSSKVTIDSKKAKQKNVIGAQLNGLPLEEFGEYKFVLSHNAKKIAQRTLKVVQGNRNDAVRS